MPWTQYTDDKSGAPYWHDAATGETTWTDPTKRGGGGGALTVVPTGGNLTNQHGKVVDRRPGDWDCWSCGIHNFGSRGVKCYSCGADKVPIKEKPTSQLEMDFKVANDTKDMAKAHQLRAELERRGIDAEQLLMRPGDWKCPKCGILNFGSRGVNCYKCGAHKDSGGGGNVFVGPGAGFGNSPSGGGGGGGSRGDWSEYTDDNTRRPYWHNKRTNETTWSKPY